MVVGSADACDGQYKTLQMCFTETWAVTHFSSLQTHKGTRNACATEKNDFPESTNCAWLVSSVPGTLGCFRVKSLLRNSNQLQSLPVSLQKRSAGLDQTAAARGIFIYLFSKADGKVSESMQGNQPQPQYDKHFCSFFAI